MNNKRLKEISFDRFSRQSRVSDIIDALRKPNEKFRILDVGGYKGLTQEFQNTDEVTILDVFDVKEKNYIKGDGLNMPFEDGEFDFVVSFDVFEHIPNKDREQFITESTRVAKQAVFTAAPIRTKANEEAEKYLNNLHKELYRKDHEWLREHIDYGLPKPNQAKKSMESNELEVLVYGSNDIVFWSLMQSAIFMNAKFKEGEKSLNKLNELYNSVAYNDGTDNPDDSYRHIVCGFKNIETAKRIEKIFSKKENSIKYEDKEKLATIISEHYKNTLMQYTKLYESLYEKFMEKVHENDQLLCTLKDVEAQKQKSPINRLKRVVRKVKR